MPSCCEALAEGKARIKTLFFQSPRELWVIYLVLFLESFAVFSTSLILTNFLTDEYGYSDSQAGFAYGLYGTLVSVFSVLVGTLVDVLGVRKSLLLSATILTCSRIAIALVRNSTVVIALMYTTIPLGMAICSPAQLTGLRRFTTPITQPFAFSLFYVAMNVAALFSGWMVDILRAALEVSSSSASSANCAVPTAFPTNSSGVDPTPVPVVHSELGPYRVLILIGASTTILQLLLIAFLMRPKNQESNDDAENNSNREIAPEPESRSYLEMLQEIFCEPEHRFWRFLLFVALLTGVKQVFRHLDATVPKYLIRSAGCSAPFGLIYSLNPFLIIILVPLITSLTVGMPIFNQIIVGATLSGVAPFIMTLANGSYVTVVLFVITMSVGEALWSPRLLEYSTTISPKGLEGTYLALGSIPQFLAKFLVGMMSGTLLQSYCPCSLTACEPCCSNPSLPDGVQGCSGGQSMWAIIGASTVVSPILILLLRSVIEKNASFNHTVDASFSRLEPDLADAFRHEALWSEPTHGSTAELGAELDTLSGNNELDSTSESEYTRVD